jgi:hypothetical protein
MTLSGGITKFFNRLPGRWWLRSLKPAALAIALLVFPALTSASHAVPASGANGVHVYLLRGVLNVFSLGLDGIASKLEAQGIPVTITNYLGWSALADEAAADYRSGKIHTIILVARLSQQGAPVKLAIGLDSVFRTSLSGRVGRYVNYYIGNGNGEPVAPTKQLRGSLENVNVQSVPGVGHLTIDKNEIMQGRVISDIDVVVFGNRPREVSGAPRPIR